MDAMQEFLEEAADDELAFLLIGGNAMRLHGHLRNTMDVDVLVPESALPDWHTFLAARGYTVFHETDAFVQFEKAQESGGLPVDLMCVSQDTWTKLRSAAVLSDVGGREIAIPRPEHLIALKLHAIRSPGRKRTDQDWDDIHQLIRLHDLDPKEPVFKEVIERYADEGVSARIQRYYDER